MKKSMFAAIGFSMLFLYGCNIVDESPVNESLEHFSNEVQEDDLFREYSKSFEYQLDLTLRSHNSGSVFDKKMYQAGIASVKSKEDYFMLCEKAGVGNPEEKLNALLRLVKAQKALFDKYPRMSQLTKTEFNQIMYRSNREISTGLVQKRYSKATD